MAITRYSGIRLVGLNVDRVGGGGTDAVVTTYLKTGTSFLETDTDKIYQWDGTGWRLLIATASVTGATESFAIAMAVAL
jgi:hypothetical protein